MPSILIGKKEQTLVQDASTQKVIYLYCSQIEIDNTDVDQDPKALITSLLSSMPNMQSFPSMLRS